MDGGKKKGELKTHFGNYLKSCPGRTIHTVRNVCFWRSFPLTLSFGHFERRLSGRSKFAWPQHPVDDDESRAKGCTSASICC